MGTDNGDSTDPDGYKNDCRRLFSGKLLLIIGSNGIREDVRIHVRRQDGVEAEMTVPVKAAGIIPGSSCRQMTIKQAETKVSHQESVYWTAYPRAKGLWELYRSIISR